MNAFEKVTQRILTQLKQGTIPWEKPWVGPETSYNRITGKAYSPLNQLLLEPGEYASMRQWNQLGGRIRKGERGSLVVFWKLLQKKPEPESEDDKTEIRKIPILKYYYVFRSSQVEGIDSLHKEEYPDVVITNHDADTVVNSYTAREGVEIVKEENGGRSYYSPLDDRITVPEKRQFKSAGGYYSTVIHELIHSTGHPDRLNRISLTSPALFGSKDYGREELVAEIGSAMLMSALGLETDNSFRNNIAYIQNWCQILEKDTHCVVIAATRAEKAVQMILGTDNKNEKD